MSRPWKEGILFLVSAGPLLARLDISYLSMQVTMEMLQFLLRPVSLCYLRISWADGIAPLVLLQAVCMKYSQDLFKSPANSAAAIVLFPWSHSASYLRNKAQDLSALGCFRTSGSWPIFNLQECGDPQRLSTQMIQPPIFTLLSVLKNFSTREREKSYAPNIFKKETSGGSLPSCFLPLYSFQRQLAKYSCAQKLRTKEKKILWGSQGWIFPRCYLNIQRGSSKNIFSYFTHYLNFICLPFISLNICSCQSRICITVTKAWEIYSCLDPISDQSNQSF